ncbi:hypothetical protein DERF_009813 [Dermatophagoides farinae]|uniref:Uncharacterized protein n=1 Tax=Dermatophagoides farinae TaxID=6954 RepID=A0A922L4D6_DERFA|nr:hypothetical protein DERF_009813 [Dermatophagoides farinae]
MDAHVRFRIIKSKLFIFIIDNVRMMAINSKNSNNCDGKLIIHTGSVSLHNDKPQRFSILVRKIKNRGQEQIKRTEFWVCISHQHKDSDE